MIEYIFTLTSIFSLLPIAALVVMILHDIWKYRGGRFLEEPNESDCDDDYYV